MKYFDDRILISLLEFNTAEDCSDVFYNKKSKCY